MNAAQAVAAVMRDLGGVGKDRKSAAAGNYSYRGIDDVINALAGPMRTHGLVIVPHVVEHDTVPVGSKGWTETRLVVEYDVIGPEGDTLPRPVRVFAVGLDNSDKGPGKALSYAYKAAISQLMCIPTDDPAMDNEASASVREPAAISAAQVKQLGDVLKPHAEAAGVWKEAWGSPLALPATLFDEAYAHAMDLVEVES